MKTWFKAIVVAASMGTVSVGAGSAAEACIGVTGRYGVVHGRSVAALVDEAEHVGAAEARPLVEEALARGGFAALAEGWTLARVMVSAGAPQAVAEALARAVGGDDAQLARRAAAILKVVGVARPEALTVVLGQAAMNARGRDNVRAALATMPDSERRAALLAMVEHMEGVSAR